MPSVAPLALASRAFSQATDEAIAEDAAIAANEEAEAGRHSPIQESVSGQNENESEEAEDRERDESKRALKVDTEANLDSSSQQHDSAVLEESTLGISQRKSPLDVSGSFRSPFARLSQRIHGNIGERIPINTKTPRADSPAPGPPPVSLGTSLPSARYNRGYHSLSTVGLVSGATAPLPTKVWLTFKTKLYLHLITFFLFYCAYLIMMLTPVEHFESAALLLTADYAWFDAGYLATVVHCAGGGFADIWPITRVGRLVTSLHLIIVFLLLVVP